MLDRSIERLDEIAGAPVYWSKHEIVDALNESQRFWALLTLCIERTAQFKLYANTAFHNIISHADTPLADFIVPLKASLDGVRLNPATFHQLNLRNPIWSTVAAIDGTTPTRWYTVMGCDLLAVSPYPIADSIMLLTYAAAPAALSLASLSAVSEAPIEDHPVILDYSIYLLMQKVGGQEFANEIPRLKTFLDEAQKRGERVRSRMKAQGYERVPFELQSYDRSALLRMKLPEQPRMSTKKAA